MIYYLTSGRNAGVMLEFLSGVGRALAGRITVLAYEQLQAENRTAFPRGTYIFTSLNQSLGSREPPSPARAWAIRLHDALATHLGPQRVLNDPAKSLRRFELLRALRSIGMNRFKAYRAGENDPAMRFPVFLRHERGTVWEAPPLLPDRETYQAQAARFAQPGLIAVEFCDTRDGSGLYRKYGCFVVGERIVPRHLFRSRDWLVKKADLVDRDAVREELEYLDANPHAGALLEVCRMARIGYGRIDYAMLGAVPQVWEINTTPQIVTRPGDDPPERLPVHEKFAAAFAAAMDALDPPGG